MHAPPATPPVRRAVAAGRRWLEHRPASPRTFDVLTALSCFALMGFDIPGLAKADNSLSGPAAIAVLAVGAATLLVRRRAPWAPYLAALLLLGWLHELTLVQFALYSVGRYRGRTAGILATVGYVVVAYALFNLPGRPDYRGDSLSDFLSLVVPIGVLASGVGIAAYRQDLVRELAAQRATTTALQAVQQERTSVARDVHDFVGRELTLLTVRAEVLSVRARGEAHQKDFDELSETARKAHRVLNEIIVRRAGEGGATPGLDGLAALATESGQAGSPVELEIAGAAYGLSPLRQAAVHRVVQECLTNAAKHAPGATVRVRITFDDCLLRIEVRNPLPDPVPARAPVSAGTGTFSMEERVRTLGGTLETGHRDGTYEVVAILPAGID